MSVNTQYKVLISLSHSSNHWWAFRSTLAARRVIATSGFFNKKFQFFILILFWLIKFSPIYFPIKLAIWKISMLDMFRIVWGLTVNATTLMNLQKNCYQTPHHKLHGCFLSKQSM
jgi:hypothetical protein